MSSQFPNPQSLGIGQSDQQDRLSQGPVDDPTSTGDQPHGLGLPASASVTPSASPPEPELETPPADTAPAKTDASEDATGAMSLEERFAGVLEEDDPIWEDCHLTRTTVAKRPKGKRLSLPEDAKRQAFNPQQRLLLLDTWRRSGLPAKDFSALVGISKHTLYKWNQLFEQQGPAGLMDEVRGSRAGSRLPDLTKRTILMLKQRHPEWGCQRISDMLLRGPALPAGASAVARVLREAGYESVQEPTRPHPDKVHRFERAKPNQLWQTDLFTFVLKRQSRRRRKEARHDEAVSRGIGKRLRQAATVLGISVNGYYLLERKALAGLTTACEAKPKGRVGPGPEQKLAAQQREAERLRRECLRQAALVRATQRAVGLPAAAPPKTAAKNGATGGKRKRRRRPTVRALRAAESLRKTALALGVFGEHGAPLVLKSDNGSAFLACVTKEAMCEALVAQLFSPPAHPQYNGQLERSNAVLKTYTELHAAAEGHPFRLTCEDVAHGFWLANALSRPWSHEGPSPEEVWQARERISAEERARFQAAWSAEQPLAAIDLGLDAAAELSHVEQAELDRLAISRTLQSLGYLTKKRVTRPPKKRKRPSRKKLAKHIAAQQKQQAVANPKEAEPDEPQSAPPLPAPARRPPQPADIEPANSPPAPLPAPDSEFSSKSAATLLAEIETGDRMEMSEDANAQRPIVRQAVAPAHGEPAITSWFRRPFTLLLSLAKTAIVSGGWQCR